MELHDFQFFTIETMVIQTIILFIILWVLNKFIFRPYLAYLDELELKQKKLEDDYKNIDGLIKEANDEKEKILTEARETSTKMISDSENMAKTKKTSIIEKAEDEAKIIIESSKAEIEKERLSMLNGVKGKLIDLILKFNTKLFGDAKVSKEYIEKELGNIK